MIRFRAPRQSTLILYRGEERVWFSVAETDSDVILGALARTRADARPSRGVRSGAASSAPGQFGVGALLGVVWLPCVGPTLSAAIALASISVSVP